MQLVQRPTEPSETAHLNAHRPPIPNQPNQVEGSEILPHVAIGVETLAMHMFSRTAQPVPVQHQHKFRSHWRFSTSSMRRNPVCSKRSCEAYLRTRLSVLLILSSIQVAYAVGFPK
eukprot:12344758-Alexandrium_andersonii.AAC.1